jgi:hypothetical protein
MAAWLPLPSGFTGYASRFVDPVLGFSLGWNYWFKVCLIAPFLARMPNSGASLLNFSESYSFEPFFYNHRLD